MAAWLAFAAAAQRMMCDDDVLGRRDPKIQALPGKAAGNVCSVVITAAYAQHRLMDALLRRLWTAAGVAGGSARYRQW